MSGKTEKKKRKHLSYKEQAEIIKKLKSGVSPEDIQRDYGICKSSCYNMWSREAFVLEKTRSCATINRKNSRFYNDSVLDEAMINWFQQTRAKGDPISGPILQEKALIFAEKLNLSPTFKVKYRKNLIPFYFHLINKNYSFVNYSVFNKIACKEKMILFGILQYKFQVMFAFQKFSILNLLMFVNTNAFVIKIYY